VNLNISYEFIRLLYNTLSLWQEEIEAAQGQKRHGEPLRFFSEVKGGSPKKQI